MGESTNTRITLGNKLIRILEPFDDVVCNALYRGSNWGGSGQL